MNPTLQRLLFSRSFWLVILFTSLVLCFAVGLSAGIRGGITNLLTITALAGALLSYSLASTRIKAWLAGLLLVFIGFFGIIFYSARLLEPFTQLYNAFLAIRAQIIFWILFRVKLPDFTLVVPPLTSLYEQAEALILRTWVWLVGLQIGSVMNDPVARAFTWTVGVFMLSAWAGWMIGRHRNTLAAFTPMIVVLAIVADYTGDGFNSLWLILAGLLLLMGLARYDMDRIRWQRTGVDFSESIPVDIGSAVVLIAVVLTALAWVMPSISVKAMVETIRDWGESQDEFAESLGLDPAPAPPSNFASFLTPHGLPRSHLLGAGPELSRQMVMIVSTGELSPRPQMSNPPPAPRHYWRGVTYDRYTGSGWLSSPVEVIGYEAGQPLIEINPEGYRPIRQEVDLLTDLGGQLHWTGYLVSVDHAFEAAWRHRPAGRIVTDPFEGADILGAISPVEAYVISSLEADLDEATLRSANGNYPPWAARYLTLPETTPERVLSLARELTASEANAYDRALAIETYLRTNYPYTLDVPAPPPGQDISDYFLFDLKKGYCDYYATSMVVLARAAGLPARFVTGYASGSYDSDNARYVVTEANAHSWAEIFFSGIGWVEFEPTAGLPPIARESQTAYASSSLPPAEVEEETTESKVRTLMKGILLMIAQATLLASILGAIVLWLETGLLLFQPAERSLTTIFRRMEKQGQKVAGHVESETPFEFTDRLNSALNVIMGRNPNLLKATATEINSIAKVYVQSVYSPLMPARNHVTRAIHEWRRLRLHLFLAEFRVLIGRKRKSMHQVG